MGVLYRELWPQAGCADCWVPGSGLSVPKSAWKWTGLRARMRWLPVATICGTHGPELDSPFQEFQSSVLQKFYPEVCSGASTSSGDCPRRLKPPLCIQVQKCMPRCSRVSWGWCLPGGTVMRWVLAGLSAHQPAHSGVAYSKPHSGPPEMGCVIIHFYR